MDNMPFKPAQSYPSSYKDSVREIELVCPCHKGVTGRAERCGVAGEDKPVYKIYTSRHHPELINSRVALTPAGFEMPIKMIKEVRARVKH